MLNVNRYLLSNKSVKKTQSQPFCHWDFVNEKINNTLGLFNFVCINIMRIFRENLNFQ